MNKFLYDSITNRWTGPKTSMIYVYSDPHFGDVAISKMRFPHLTVEEADEYQIKQINSQIGRFNTLVLLGDVGNLECVKRLKGYKKILIMGNHDEGNASKYKRAYTVKDIGLHLDPIYYMTSYTREEAEKNRSEFKCGTFIEDNKLFDEVYEGPIMVNDRVILSHEPIEGIPSYLFNIHGHDHVGQKRDRRHYLNVCAEHVHYKPVPLLTLLKEGLISKVDSIHRETIDKATERKNKRRVLSEK